MKHRWLLWVMLPVFLMISCPAGAETSFAILPIERLGDVPPERVEETQNSMYQHMVASKRYRIVDRGRLNDLLKEQSLQLTGATDTSTMVKIGKMLNVDKFLATTLAQRAPNLFALRCSVVDVQTGQIEFDREIAEIAHTGADNGRGCVGMIIAEYPLLGEITGLAQGAVIVNLGKNQGIKNGARLFVARKTSLTGQDGKVIFQELQRVGIIEVVSAQAAMSKAKEKRQAPDSKGFMAGDLVSPDPIPSKGSALSSSPLLKNIRKGRLLLDDTMDDRQYLSVQQGMGESYHEGKLHLNATHRNSSHAYTYYPAPFDQLDNFIWEGEVEFRKTQAQYSRIDLVFRSTRDYATLECYMFFFNSDGGYSVHLAKLGRYFNIIPFTSTPLLNRGTQPNKFRIVAHGDKVDMYLNEGFLIGFENESIEKGTVGFQAHWGTYALVDNVKIWEAKGD
ncbi:MAG: hypothetical protein HXY45_17985 [Syntrophaceae bacterium]|nr:hypothetical protein [Syntrophaceae bacterium]